MSIRYEDLLCGVDTSRDDVAQHELVQGIDFIEIVTEPAADNQRVLLVSFIPKSTLAGQIALTDMLDLLDGNLNAVEIAGGVRVRDVEILAVERDGTRLRIRVDQPGDFSDYRLTIHHTFAPGDDPTQPPPKLHPAYASVVFNFKAACPSHFDCRTDRDCPPPEELTRTIDYLARDYASFRQALFDLIPTLHPDWLERSTADLGTALIELMAYSADHLSYYQDAVANEAWLETARQRISVRRHTRLIDYAMHDGASARVFVHLTANDTGVIEDGTQILTRLTAPVAGRDTHATVITGYGPEAARAAQAVFEVYGGGASLHPTLNQLDIYAWGRGKCCLPRGTTRCDVDADVTALLKPGDFLLLEELDSFSLLPDETQPDHRQVVRLVSVTPTFDPLVPAKALTRLVWHDDDALTFPLCIAVIDDTGGTRQTGVARGNIVLADHGRTIETEWYPEAPGFEAQGISLRSGRAFRFFLDEGPLSFRIAAPATASAASLRATDPHAAGAEVKTLVPAKTDGTLLFGEQDWLARPTLLSSSATNTHFVIETDNDGRAMIRFGDGVAGMLPPEGSLLRTQYRVGVGTAGNVGPGALRHVVGDASLPVDEVRNPLASWGGIAPEDLDEVKLTAPAAMRARSERAVTEDDYAKAAMLHPLVSKAVATFRWTGTWHTVFVAVDPKGNADLTPELEDSVREWLTRFLQTGYDLEIDPPTYVPVELTIEVCAAPGHFRTDVEEAINAALSRAGGFFDPDRYTFGQPLYLSKVYEAVTSVEGVLAAEVLQFHRYGDAPAGELERGAIVVGRTEIIRLDNDPNFPDNGVFHLDMRSGK